MRPEVSAKRLKDTRAWEHVVRFVFGGAITVATGLIADAWGAAVAGLFLAFPAILPASITLVKQHERRAEAVEDARGARLGSVALCAFALAVVATLGVLPAPLVLVVASAVWLVVAVGLWFVRYELLR